MTAEVIPFVKPEDKPQVCSFCKISKAQAKAMIQSKVSDHCICDSCIKKCKDRLNETA
jgi:hypothetical protein